MKRNKFHVNDVVKINTYGAAFVSPRLRFDILNNVKVVGEVYGFTALNINEPYYYITTEYQLSKLYIPEQGLTLVSTGNSNYRFDLLDRVKLNVSNYDEIKEFIDSESFEQIKNTTGEIITVTEDFYGVRFSDSVISFEIPEELLKPELDLTPETDKVFRDILKDI